MSLRAKSVEHVDFEKAFDRVLHRKLMEALRDTGIDENPYQKADVQI